MQKVGEVTLISRCTGHGQCLLRLVTLHVPSTLEMGVTHSTVHYILEVVHCSSCSSARAHHPANGCDTPPMSTPLFLPPGPCSPQGWWFNSCLPLSMFELLMVKKVHITLCLTQQYLLDCQAHCVASYCVAFFVHSWH